MGKQEMKNILRQFHEALASLRQRGEDLVRVSGMMSECRRSWVSIQPTAADVTGGNGAMHIHDA